MKAKWKNWWWYHWWHVLLAAAAAGVILYSFLPGLFKPKEDYSVGIISVNGLTEETVSKIEERLLIVAEDVNGDGNIHIRINQFTVDLSGAASAANYQETARLDADLVGKISCILFIEDYPSFKENTAVPVDEGIPCASLPLFDGLELPKGMVLTVRSDSSEQAPFDMYQRAISGK